MLNNKLILLLGSLLWLGLLSGCGEPERNSFFTQGNCEECGKLIEASIKALPGVDSVGWDFETSFTTVKYRPNRINRDEIQQAAAAAGFETQFYPANAEALKKLPECCQQPIDRELKRIETALPEGH